MSAYTERHARSFGGWLLLFGVAYAVMHHAGTVFADVGEVGAYDVDAQAESDRRLAALFAARPA